MRVPLGQVSFDARVAILRLYAGNWPTGRIARKFGVTEESIRSHASRIGLRKGQLLEIASTDRGSSNGQAHSRHQALRKAARRGYAVPPDREEDYFDLLIAGLDTRQAAFRAAGDNSSGQAGEKVEGDW